MYQDNRPSINWVKLFLRVIILFLIIILGMKLISLFLISREESSTKSNLTENLKRMDTFAKTYFQEIEKPSEPGSSVQWTLFELIQDELIKDIKDKDGNNCNYDESFIKITRLDSEYQINSSLVCGNEHDYMNSFIKVEDSDITIRPTVTTTTKIVTTQKETKKKTTKKVTTKKEAIQSKRFKVSFNTNGGQSISTQMIKQNEKIQYIIPIREGYNFVGWYYRGKEFDLQTKVNQDYVLVAKWSKK